MELIKQQEFNSTELQQAIKNYKKSPSDRKTLDYLRNQLAKLTQLWEKFHECHAKIKQDNTIPADHEYYKTQLYEVVSGMYHVIASKINDEIDTIEAGPNGASTSRASTSRVPELPLKLQRGISSIQSLLAQVAQEQQSAEFLAMKLHTIEQQWKLVCQLHEKLWSTTNDGYNLDEFLHQENIISIGIFNLSERIKAMQSSATSATNDSTIHNNPTNHNDIKLPRIELPTFDGNYLNWRQYRDLFSEMVHQQPMPNCQKLWYLKSTLTGDAARLIQHFTSTSENYLSAWQVVNNRYENKRLLVGALLSRLLSQTTTQRDSAASIRNLHDTTLECLLGIQALQINTDDWDPLLVHLVTQCVDRHTILLWEQSLQNPRELPSLKEFLSFLELRFQSMENVVPTRKAIPSSNTFIATIDQCLKCKQDHGLTQCQQFKNLTVKQRLQLIQSNNRCVNCLKPGHKTKQCSSSRNCQRCHKRHNTLLHLDQPDSISSNPRSSSNSQTSASTTAQASRKINQVASPSPSSLIVSSDKDRTSVLLSTVVIKVEDAYGQQIECRAILDNGSQVHLITNELARKLGLPVKPHQLRIQGIGETQRDTANRVNVRISSRVTGFSSRVEALVLPKIVPQQPHQFIERKHWKIPKNLPLADPQFNIPGEVDMLIGAGLFYTMLSIGQVKLGNGQPLLQNTVLGWVLGGEYIMQPEGASRTCGMLTEEELFSSMEKFWELEECANTTRPMTTAELKVEKQFVNQHRRSDDGRFVVKLPFQEEKTTLGQSYDIALQRLKGVEKRLHRDDTLKQEYIKFMHEYEHLGHMEEITLEDIKGPHYFLPHHAVLKPDSTTTKVRVVFDASAKTSNNISLNDILSAGPTIQDDVFTQLLRFRFPRFAFTADIEKMYRQIWVHNDDRKLQLILWRKNPQDPIQVYQLNTITYGTACAPFLAIRCLRQLGDDGRQIYPLASNILQRNFYVDDVLAGSDNISTTIDQVIQLRQLLSSAGFNLRKWCSNDQRILNQVPKEDQEVSLELTPTGSTSVKTMGLIWTPREDCFSLKTSPTTEPRVTKRIALAETSRIFDPLGFLAPVTITAKIFLQNLWKLKLDWDAALPQDLYTEWTMLRNGFTRLNEVKVPRHVFGHEKTKNVQIHIFADASEKAYGAVAYVRSINPENIVIARLLCAKTKVAPTKQTSLPRLELCAAKLAADMMKRIQVDLDITQQCFHLWSDSTAVLGWINAKSSNYHTFVANRIAAIQRITSNAQWHHVASCDNPADVISRGLRPEQLINNHFWFYGPKFLLLKTDTWTNNENHLIDCELEKREKVKISMTIIRDDDIVINIDHHNSFRRLQRIVAYLFRWSKPKTPGSELLGAANLVIRPQELETALEFIVKYIQKTQFLEHILCIRKNNHVQHTSSLAHLSPFIDEKGILRVGGRLEAADLSYDAKHPMLLCHKHPLTKLLLTELHQENMHVGVQTLLAMSRQRFWIINGKTLARSVIHGCVHCTKMRPKLAGQIMGQLPKDRVTATRPFYIAGVDFFGPIYVHYKIRGKRPVKAYVAVFCCFSTKAVHLEVVNDLSTEAFIGALKRFIGRRGRCKRLYCDNATNFCGARNSLAELSPIIHNEDAQKKILSTCSKNNIEFCFIPPRAPHFGGLWEAAVKSAKGLMQRTLQAASLTYEEMETVLIDAEAILNSRPLTPMSSDPNDMSALTPGHFLIGEPLTAISDPYQSPAKISSLSRWNLVKHLKNEFWRRWSLEYLNSLQHRYKWNQESDNIKPGTMVIIKDDNLPPLKWALGRVENAIHGADGKVRVADVRTASNTIRRPIHKLAPLPIQDTTEISSTAILTNKEQPSETTGATLRQCTQNRKRRAGSSIASLLVTCLFLPLIAPVAHSASVNFGPFQGDPGIYFERIGLLNVISTNWNLVNYIDLRQFWRESEIANKYTTTLSDLCKAVKVSKTCKKTVNIIEQQIHTINMNSEMLRYRRRTKRGALNIVGNMANGLFGLLDSEYAEKLSYTIDNLRANDEILRQQIENQTTFLDRTMAIMRKNQEEIEKEFETVEQILHKTADTLNDLSHHLQLQEITSKFNEMALQAWMQISRFQSIQDSIIDIITDAHHGRLSPELLSPRELRSELQQIEAHNAKGTKLPFDIENITQYYRIMVISHQITANHIIFNIKIPLTTLKQFELLKLTPIPWVKNNTFYHLQLPSAYLSVDLLREHHFTLSHDELQSCMSIDAELFFCHPSQPIYNPNTSKSQCEMNILKESKITTYCRPSPVGNTPSWIALYNPNMWLYSVGDQELVHIVCNNNPSQVTIKGSGVVTIEEGCIIKTPQVTIEGHTELKTVRQVVYTPVCNISTMEIEQLPEIKNYSNSYHSSRLELIKLQSELRSVKVMSLNTLRPHDIHHYGLGYIIFILLLCCIAWLAVLYRKQRLPPPPTPAPRRDVPQAQTEDTDSKIITMFNS